MQDDDAHTWPAELRAVSDTLMGLTPASCPDAPAQADLLRHIASQIEDADPAEPGPSQPVAQRLAAAVAELSIKCDLKGRVSPGLWKDCGLCVECRFLAAAAEVSAQRSVATATRPSADKSVPLGRFTVLDVGDDEHGVTGVALRAEDLETRVFVPCGKLTASACGRHLTEDILLIMLPARP